MKPQTVTPPFFGKAVEFMRPRLHIGRDPHPAALLLALALLFVLAAGGYSSAHAGFNYRKPLTIQGSKVDGEVQNFPVLVSITDPDLTQHVSNTLGYDIVFRAADGVTALPHEVESYNHAAGTLIAWVKVPALKAGENTTIYMYYGDSAITSETQTPSAVWDDNFKGVWHLKETSGPFIDSSSKANHGADQVSAAGKTGKIGSGQQFDGTNDYLNVGNKSDFNFGTVDFTISYWVKTNATGTRYIMTKRQTCDAANSFWVVSHDTASVFEASQSGGTLYGGVRDGSRSIANNQWRHVQVQRSANTINFWVDGNSTSYALTRQNLSNTASLKIGDAGPCAGDFAGYLDEVRISHGVRSAGWIKTEYANQNDPATFIRAGAEENVGVVFFKIAAVAGDGGSITPAGETSVQAGQGQVYTITPNSNYKLGTVLVNGAAVSLSSGQYTFTNVQAHQEIVASFLPVSSGGLTLPPLSGDVVPGCGLNAAVNYGNSSGFNAAGLNLIAAEVDPVTKWVALKRDPIGADNPVFVVPFTQNIIVTSLSFCSSAPSSDFGWMYPSDLPADKSQPDRAKMHNIFTDMRRADVAGNPHDCSVILNGFQYGPRGNVLDNRVNVGTFAAGTELVFWSNVDYTGNDYAIYLLNSWGINPNPRNYYTKKDWNQDVYNYRKANCLADAFDKTVNYWQYTSDDGVCRPTTGLMNACTQDPIVKGLLEMNFAGVTKRLRIEKDKIYQHSVSAFSNNKPNELIMGWEEFPGGEETDMNDHVYHIEGLGGGQVQLKNPIIPASENYITTLDVTVWDRIAPCAVGATAPYPIKYFVSINNGNSWVELTHWDETWSTDAAKNDIALVASWAPGNPEYTRRRLRLDFASLGITGRELLWKAEFRTASLAAACPMPAVIDVNLRADGMLSGYFSRGAPVVKANVAYSGYYQTPASNWRDKSMLRGHLTATEIYPPDRPDQSGLSEAERLRAREPLWDAGERLTQSDPSLRRVYFPDIAVGEVTDALIATGDAVQQTFKGILTPNRIAATTLVITDGREIFRDKHTDVLEGHLGGTGTINRFTGVFSLTFSSPVDLNAPITASYRFYDSNPALAPFAAAQVSKSLLGLDDTQIVSQGYLYDFDQNDIVTDNDAHLLMDWVRGYELGTKVKREWLLGAIDHSVPALVTPPGLPQWYFGTATTKQERQSFEAFIRDNASRPTVLFAGARDGMLHAFNAGSYRHGDNTATAFTEKRGYFLPGDKSANCPGYCSSSCSSCPVTV